MLGALLVSLLAFASGSALAQGVLIYYVYDELNRLVAVVDQQGNVGSYSYDPAGNLTRIDRFDVAGIPGGLGITFVSPGRGKVGTEVQIFGKGFSAIAGQNTITFNGTPATVTAAAPNRLKTSVPPGATTGPITVSTPLGSASSPNPFVVLASSLTVVPSAPAVVVGGSVRFQAQDAGVATASVRWAVNGVTGGDTPTGTITTGGLYRTPTTVPAVSVVTVTATSTDDSSVSGSTTVAILPALPMFATARGVTVAVAAPASSSALASFATSPGVAVTIASAGATMPSFVTAPGVTVTVAAPAATATIDSFAASRIVAVVPAPLVTSVTPANGLAGTAVTLTLTGNGFTGATSVKVLRNDDVDPAITTQNLVVDGSGSNATVNLVIAAGAPLGARVIQITTPAGVSQPIALGGNVFTVQ